MIQSIILILVISMCFLIAYFKASHFTFHSKISPSCYGFIGALVSIGCALTTFCLLLPLRGPRFSFIIIVSGVVGGILFWDFMTPAFCARYWSEKVVRICLRIASLSAMIITFAITIVLFLESLRFFRIISILEFVSGTRWSPRTTYSESSGIVDFGFYGAIPLFLGTLMITSIAIVIAVPLGLCVALYLKEFARPYGRRILKPLIEILAGIPTIVYGFFALIVVMPTLQKLGEILHIEISSQSALGVGIVMGLMIIPYISSLSEEALNAVPQALRDNSLALGATAAETILKVVLPSALPGIVTAVLLALSRAIGETMLVVMAAGLSPRLTLNPLNSVTTVTVQIVSLLTGDQEFNSPKTLSAFALGMTLFLLTLGFNIISGYLVKRHRRKYGL